MLQLDIRSVHQGRGRQPAAERGAAEQLYSCRFDALELEFVTLEQRVEVRRCVQHVPAGSRPART